MHEQLWLVDDPERRRVAIIVASYGNTQPEELAEAQAIIDSIRFDRTPADEQSRLVFMLPGGWDSG